ncbi:Arc family DNA-binding protein [Aeromonas veronii]|uniref:Arc family DNA-binding protein n=1 Tax=Aeromonas veronii TaxID=654 RepID=UPI000E08F363|nr:Arc family DNA-binding protein [Aeromonas veronii]
MMSRDDPQTRVRMNLDLKNMLMDAAKANKRTFTAEVNARLIESFNARGSELDGQAIQKQLDAIANYLGMNQTASVEGASK